VAATKIELPLEINLSAHAGRWKTRPSVYRQTSRRNHGKSPHDSGGYRKAEQIARSVLETFCGPGNSTRLAKPRQTGHKTDGTTTTQTHASGITLPLDGRKRNSATLVTSNDGKASFTLKLPTGRTAM